VHIAHHLSCGSYHCQEAAAANQHQPASLCCDAGVYKVKAGWLSAGQTRKVNNKNGMLQVPAQQAGDGVGQEASTTLLFPPALFITYSTTRVVSTAA
jgi:hypothetical protein